MVVQLYYLFELVQLIIVTIVANDPASSYSDC